VRTGMAKRFFLLSAIFSLCFAENLFAQTDPYKDYPTITIVNETGLDIVNLDVWINGYHEFEDWNKVVVTLGRLDAGREYTVRLDYLLRECNPSIFNDETVNRLSYDDGDSYRVFDPARDLYSFHLEGEGLDFALTKYNISLRNGQRLIFTMEDANYR
jgi:hypothetical protein